MTSNPNKYVHHLDGTTEIFISYKGQTVSCFVDTRDYPLVKKYRWWIAKTRHFVYARTKIRGKAVSMHRLILNLRKRQVVDHMDHNGLNNRRGNLRAATPSQNSANRIRTIHTSRFKGVIFCKLHGKYLARIGVNYKRIFLGYFDREKDAAAAYQVAAKKYFGDFALAA